MSEYIYYILYAFHFLNTNHILMKPGAFSVSLTQENTNQN